VRIDIPDHWAQNPLAFAVGCVAFIPMAFWIVMVVRWTIQGELDGLTGFFACAAGFMLGFFAINPPVPVLGPVSMLVMLSTMAAYPFARAALAQREISQMDTEQIAGAYERLEVSPNDGPARIRLARALVAKGFLGHAIGVLDQALRGLPPQFYREEARLLQRWQREARDPKVYDPMPCVRCSTNNAPGEVFCTKCGAPFLLDNAKGLVVAPDHLRRVLAFWLIAVILIAGLPAAAAALPPLLAVAAIVGMLGLAGFVAYRTLRTRPVADLT
jgi:hypothetical protein